MIISSRGSCCRSSAAWFLGRRRAASGLWDPEFRRRGRPRLRIFAGNIPAAAILQIPARSCRSADGIAVARRRILDLLPFSLQAAVIAVIAAAAVIAVVAAAAAADLIHARITTAAAAAAADHHHQHAVAMHHQLLLLLAMWNGRGPRIGISDAEIDGLIVLIATLRPIGSRGGGAAHDRIITIIGSGNGIADRRRRRKPEISPRIGSAQCTGVGHRNADCRDRSILDRSDRIGSDRSDRPAGSDQDEIRKIDWQIKAIGVEPWRRRRRKGGGFGRDRRWNWGGLEEKEKEANKTESGRKRNRSDQG
jgi:hypothetical protein